MALLKESDCVFEIQSFWKERNSQNSPPLGNREGNMKSPGKDGRGCGAGRASVLTRIPSPEVSQELKVGGDLGERLRHAW